jgi:hypothetical protein
MAATSKMRTGNSGEKALSPWKIACCFAHVHSLKLKILFLTFFSASFFTTHTGVVK